MAFSPWNLPMPYSNLQCFLQCITPTVPIRLLSNKRCIHNSNGFLQTLEKDKVEGFSLSEVWQCYSEWSAYGAGVPIVLNNGDHVVQYYSPSLSALQVYTTKPFSSSTSNLFHQIADDEKFWGLGNTAKPENGSCCNDRGREKNKKSSSHCSCLGSNDSTTFQFGSFTHTTDQCGYLYYQYNEMASPHDRVPFKEKINELAKHYPGLLDLHSTDLSPYSWMAIAWYPVYQVPVARNVKELSACFLTYHPLMSSLSQGPKNIMVEKEKVEGISSCGGVGDQERIRSGSSSGKEEISLPTFALVTYKMYGTLWINPETSDQDSIICRQTAACYWLKLLHFHHHDFNFFMSRQFLNY
ncbi:hypothetical protein REPUB_Repub01dG0152600 [Reevesia pubescens]